MLRFWKTFRYVALGGFVLQLGGCFGGQIWREVLIAGITSQAFEFLLDNNGIFDLFTDN